MSSSMIVNIGSDNHDNGLLLDQHQAITWTSSELLACVVEQIQVNSAESLVDTDVKHYILQSFTRAWGQIW